jgi:hypothetical protein
VRLKIEVRGWTQFEYPRKYRTISDVRTVDEMKDFPEMRKADILNDEKSRQKAEIEQKRVGRNHDVRGNVAWGSRSAKVSGCG